MLVLLATVGAERLSVRRRAEGLLPAAGHRPDDRRHPGGSEHLVPAHAEEAAAVHRDRPARSRRCDTWSASPAAAAAADQFRLRLRRAEAAGRAQASRPIRSSRGCAASWRRCRARRCSCRRCRISASAAGRATRTTSTRCRATTSPTLYALGAEARRRRCSTYPVLTDVNTDQQQNGLETDLVIDRDTAARLGLTAGADRQHALRRLRPAPGLDDLQRAQPVPRGHGGGAALLAEPGDAEGHLCQHRRAAPSSGTQSTNAVVGTVTARPAAASSQTAAAARSPPDSARNLPPTNRARRSPASGSASTGAAVSTSAETMVPLAAFSQLRAGQHAARGQSPGAVRRHHDLLQPGAGQVAERRRRRRSTRR